MPTILGMSAWFHDSSACLINDDGLVAFAEEERFTRRKHTPEYPRNAINFCLEQGDISLDDVDAVVYYFSPALLVRNNVSHILHYLPGSLNLFRRNTTVVPKSTRYVNLFRLKSILAQQHDARGDFKLVCLPHYQTHQGAAFYCSAFEDAAIITLDVAVDGITQTIGHGRGHQISDRLKHRLPHGWGMIYSLFTQYVGFTWYDEYKVMGMSAYGEPKYVDFIEDNLYSLDPTNGDFKLNLDYFKFQHYGMLKVWSNRLIRELGPARDPSQPLRQRDYDMAASVQRATERFGVRMAQLAKNLTGANNLCMAGGVVLNCLMNQKIMESGVFNQVYLQPLASDVGSSLGAALYYQHCVLHQPRTSELQHLYWGPDFSDRCEETLRRTGLCFHRFDNAAPLIARAIADGEIVGYFKGRMEAGPRALGARSIIADPRRHDMKDILNLRVKHREHFRPFAPSCLEEHLHDVFEPIPACRSWGSMITTANVRADMKEIVPAITHNDGTARPQAVSRQTNPEYWEIINEFYKLTGVPLVVNTSFNDNEPIVCTPLDALKCFLKTRIDLLVLGNLLVYRKENVDRIDQEIERFEISTTRSANNEAERCAA